MAVYKQKTSKNWWYCFVWNGKRIRQSTRQPVKRVAEQMEALHKANLAKNEAGITEKKEIPTFRTFAEREFLPFVLSRFSSKPKTLEYYANGLKSLLSFDPIASSAMDNIKQAQVRDFVSKRRGAQLQVSSINRELEVLRRMLRLALEWGVLDQPAIRIQMLPGEATRSRVLSRDEECRYLAAAEKLATQSVDTPGLRSTESTAQLQAGPPPTRRDPFLLRDVVTILLDCGLRPDELFRLRWENVHEGSLHIASGKTASARRQVPMTDRVASILEMRKNGASVEWVFPAPTRSAHIEKSTLRKQHRNVLRTAGLAPFSLYTFRHTCLTRWAAHMDPYTLAYLAGHADFSTTKRYVHPEIETVRRAIERARGDV